MDQLFPTQKRACATWLSATLMTGSAMSLVAFFGGSGEAIAESNGEVRQSLLPGYDGGLVYTSFRDTSSVLHRVGGVVAMAGGGALVYMMFDVNRPSLRMLATAPVLFAMGVWFVVFGYPRDVDGMAPAWWRAGLALAAAVALVVTLTLWSSP